MMHDELCEGQVGRMYGLAARFVKPYINLVEAKHATSGMRAMASWLMDKAPHLEDPHCKLCVGHHFLLAESLARI